MKSKSQSQFSLFLLWHCLFIFCRCRTSFFNTNYLSVCGIFQTYLSDCLSRPVRMSLDLATNMQLCGKRSPVLAKYKVGQKSIQLFWNLTIIWRLAPVCFWFLEAKKFAGLNVCVWLIRVPEKSTQILLMVIILSSGTQ